MLRLLLQATRPGRQLVSLLYHLDGGWWEVCFLWLTVVGGKFFVASGGRFYVAGGG